MTVTTIKQLTIRKNQKPAWIGFHIGKYHLSFGFYNKLDVYLDEDSKTLKTKKVGEKFFFAACVDRPYESPYEKLLKELNAGV